MLTYQDFCTKYQFKGCQTNQDARQVFDFLCDPARIYNMMIFSDLSLPAMSGIVEELEQTFENAADFSLGEGQNRKIVGRMVKFILDHFGYTPLRNSSIRNQFRNFSNAKLFKTAAVYEKTKTGVHVIDVKIR